MSSRSSRFALDGIKDWHVAVILAVVSVLSRIPFLDTFNVVAHDGTYYLNQARALLRAEVAGGSFPVGYPATVALFQLVLRNTALAGQAVSFVASVGAAIVIFHLARHYVSRANAFLCAMVLALNPLFIRLSLMTLSESLYIFWLLLGLLMGVRRHALRFGVTMGLATITRPESLAVFVLVGTGKLRKPAAIATAVVSFALIYGVNSAYLSKVMGRVVIVPKSEFFGTSARAWQGREALGNIEDKEQTLAEMTQSDKETTVVGSYLRRLPREVGLVIRHTLPAVFLLALFGAVRKRWCVLLPPLIPFLVYPLVTVRSIDRYILPYIPILILYSLIGLEAIGRARLRSLALALVLVSVIVLPVVNSDALLVPEEPGLEGMKAAGLAYKDRVPRGTKVADRKPHFAFYAECQYVEIPIAPYNETLEELVADRVRLLAMEAHTISAFRPGLRPLLYDRAVLAGELRFEQRYFSPTGEMVLERVRDADPLQWTPVTPDEIVARAPAWSPNGVQLAFRAEVADGRRGIFATDGERTWQVCPTEKIHSDAPAWSPDGARVAFVYEVGGRLDIYDAPAGGGEAAPLVESGANDWAPAWSPEGAEIFFTSDRTGTHEIWSRLPATGELRQYTQDDNNSHPSPSPDGKYLAWIKPGEGIVVIDRATGRASLLQPPRSVQYAPTWSADGRYLAVTAQDWGSWDIYLIKVDGTNAVLLTKNRKRDAMPVWHPTRRRIALMSERERELGAQRVWVIENLEPYLERLEEPPRRFQTLPPPPE